jgi:hypothetical protein
MKLEDIKKLDGELIKNEMLDKLFKNRNVVGIKNKGFHMVPHESPVYEISLTDDTVITVYSKLRD